MLQFTDHIGHQITLSAFPQRIVSLVPSLTQLLHFLHLEPQVVGITKFCVHPNEWFRSKTRIGGTKNVSIEKLQALQPDLVIASKEENVKEQVEAIQKICPVFVTDIINIPTALQGVIDIGQLTNTLPLATQLKKTISQQLVEFNSLQTYRTLYLIWNEPYMSIGADTYIHHTLQALGFNNVLGQYQRYPLITPIEISTIQPDVIMLSSEPYPFKEKHIHALQALVPTAKVILVNGEIISWYGNAMLQLSDYGKTLHKLLEK